MEEKTISVSFESKNGEIEDISELVKDDFSWRFNPDYHRVFLIAGEGACKEGILACGEEGFYDPIENTISAYKGTKFEKILIKYKETKKG